MNIAVDFETTKDPKHLPYIPDSQAVCAAVVTDTGHSDTFVFYHKDSYKSFREELYRFEEVLKKADRIIAHNLKFDYMWLHHLGIDIDNKLLFCTQTAEYVIRHHQRLDGLSLNALAEQYGLGQKDDRVAEFWNKGIDTPDIPLDILLEYVVKDTVLCLEIFKRQVKSIKEQQLETPISLDMAVIPAIAAMEYNGMALDLETLCSYKDEYSRTLEEIDKELSELLGIENPGSAQQLSCGLFGGTYKVDGVEEYTRTLKSGEVKTYTRKCKVDKLVKGIGFDPKRLGISETKHAGIYETNVQALSLLKPKTKVQKRVVELLYERSRMSQLLSMYFIGLYERQIDGVIHPTINNTVTATSRFSSSNPNGQNIPRGNTGPVKKCFVTRFAEARNTCLQ